MEAPEKDQRRGEREERGDGPDAAEEIERLKAELQREHERLLRALADFENYRRRVERDRASAARSGKRDVLLRLLDVLDGFDRALGHLDAAPPSSIRAGVQALHRKLLGALQAEGVSPMESLGATFDPRFHEAIGTMASDRVESGAVVEELQRGYRWGEDVLRPARVRVAV